VGYTKIAFYGDTIMPEEHENKTIDDELGKILLKTARKTIADRLGLEGEPEKKSDGSGYPPELEKPRGTFVTLKINNQLRGCIGNLTAEKPVLQGVKDNAINAAFHDPRFSPLSKEEFDKIQIEVSLLTQPEPLEYKNGADLLDKLRPHIDGVIIQKGPCSATFLPQVWEQLPDKQAFLQQLCMKAGLGANEWQKGDLRVLTYQVQYFEEPM
jgi:AmmeMemoRadiSam system protein A